MQDFRIAKTPETRTPYVLALLAIVGVLNAALRWFLDFRYSVEVFLLTATAAIAYAIWLYSRQHPRQKTP